MTEKRGTGSFHIGSKGEGVIYVSIFTVIMTIQKVRTILRKILIFIT